MKKEIIDNIYQQLIETLDKENIFLNEPMKKHTSFKIGGDADIFVKVKKVEELKSIIQIAKANQIPFFVMGNGSNLLVKDLGIRGIVIKIEFDKMEIVKREDVLITVGAGVKLGLLARRLLKENITGFEFASGIPGTIGGAVRMNAGAYGGEMKDIVSQTTYMDESGNIHTISNKDHEFEYRNSIFSKHSWIILESVLKLKEGQYEEIDKKMKQYNEQRKEKQPISFPNAGSTFKRGNGYITAKLIDECGLKGYSIGDAQVSDIHAGFIINKGKATAQEVLELIEYVKEKVYEKFQVEIQTEVEIIGE